MEKDHHHETIVRQYEVRDRDSVRRIALDTADIGDTVENFIVLGDSMADFLTRYYTDYEPESAWVAESGGNVVGYILGSVNQRKYNSAMEWIIIPAAAVGAIGEGILWKKEAWKLLGMVVKGTGGQSSGKNSGIDDYPAHIHINMDKGFRGGGIGRKLIERFEEHAKKAKMKGIHARVRGDNESGRKFFERMGFSVIIESVPVKLDYLDGTFKEFTFVTYGKIL